MLDKIIVRRNQNEPSKLDDIIRGSYDDFVRLERRNLLVVSSLTIFLIYGEAERSSYNASFSGIKLPNIAIENIFFALFLTCLYFSIAYLVYAYPGYRDAMQKWRELKGRRREISATTDCEIFYLFGTIKLSNFILLMRYYCWLIINYIFPILLGVCSTFLSFMKSSL